MHRHRRVDVGGDHPDPVADGGASVGGRERDVLVAAEPHGGAVDAGIAVIHPERLQPDVGDDVGRPDRDHGPDDESGLGERQPDGGVVRVHEREPPAWISVTPVASWRS